MILYDTVQYDTVGSILLLRTSVGRFTLVSMVMKVIPVIYTNCLIVNCELFLGHMSTTPVFVTLGGGQPVIIHIANGAFVGHLVDAVIAKLKLDVTANMVLLRFAPSAAGEPGLPLNPRNKLFEAGVSEMSDLVIEVIDASAVGACIRKRLIVKFFF
jgi:hypothetical protein